jgi:hypothetical protein
MYYVLLYFVFLLITLVKWLMVACNLGLIYYVLLLPVVKSICCRHRYLRLCNYGLCLYVLGIYALLVRVELLGYRL